VRRSARAAAREHTLDLEVRADPAAAAPSPAPGRQPSKRRDPVPRPFEVSFANVERTRRAVGKIFGDDATVVDRAASAG
jgi:hypothetical protein